MKISLIIPIFNRPAYVKKCFDSLLKLTIKPDLIVLVDDASTDRITDECLNQFIVGMRPKNANTSNVIYLQNEVNLGVKLSLRDGCAWAFGRNADIVINLDSDAIVKPDFIERLLEARGFNPLSIVSGFNFVSENNKATTTYFDVCAKPFCNGINMAFTRSQYDKYIKPSLLKEGNWDYNTSLACQADNLPFIIIVPSVVQHIGINSSMGHVGADVAQDFKMLHLPDVTLFGIDSHNVAGIQRAAQISQQNIQFAECNIITNDLFTKGGDNETRRRDYSKFMIKDLATQFSTSHVLTIHADGYVLDWSKWDNSWLEWDYIGASWLYKDGMNVGNGGFSLRSKKLCDILAKNEIAEHLMHPEDHCICRTYRRSLEENFGIKFAPEDVANRFSIEAYGSAAIQGANKYSGQFGFHGVHVDFSGCELQREILYPPYVPITPEEDRVKRVREYQRRNAFGVPN